MIKLEKTFVLKYLMNYNKQVLLLVFLFYLLNKKNEKYIFLITKILLALLFPFIIPLINITSIKKTTSFFSDQVHLYSDKILI